MYRLRNSIVTGSEGYPLPIPPYSSSRYRIARSRATFATMLAAPTIL